MPSRIDLAAWEARIFNNPAIPRYFLNSLIVGVGTTLLTLVLATPAAYGLAHLPIRGKGAFILISLSSLMFPAIMLATPLFVIFGRLRLLDSYTGLIIGNTALALPFALVVLRPFFLSLPPQLTEAAKIDGCTVWGAFLRVMLPLAVPGIATAAIFTFLFGWNDLVFALTMTSSDKLPARDGGVVGLYRLERDRLGGGHGVFDPGDAAAPRDFPFRPALRGVWADRRRCEIVMLRFTKGYFS